MHGECMAQALRNDLKEEDKARMKEETALKKARRAEYDIGWRVERVPRIADAATKLSCSPLPQGMCCIVLEEESKTVRVEPTVDPAGAVNLEYLSIALQVRLSEGREPLFSLDPVIPQDQTTRTFRDEMQLKRFEPAWLAGTSLGEVLFQADYYLKELSMGEYEQPVLGMKSCFDILEELGDKTDWRAREWFVVRKAEVHLSQDKILIPYVKMGVEAREQVLGAEGLEDARITSADHPLVQYAETFTRYFDLIAERKSVVYHLREVAKASTLAKYLIDAEVNLEESWFNLQGEAKAGGPMQIPQLWNEHCHSQIRVRDGELVEATDGCGTSMRGVYGGVDFGLDRFHINLSALRRVTRNTTLQPTTVLADVGARMIVPGRPKTGVLHLVGQPTPTTGVTADAQLPSMVLAATGAAPAALPTIGQREPPVPVFPRLGAPLGVDLNLDEFDLSQPTRVVSKAHNLKDCSYACRPIGNAFWSSIENQVIDGEASVFKDSDKNLLKDIFNPCLSDRREEGDLFAPPDASCLYVQQLRVLVEDEHEMRQMRRKHFFSEKFMMEDPGPLFPASWTSTLDLENRRELGHAPEKPSHGGVLVARPDYVADTAVFDRVFRSAALVFDKIAEDGVKFRIYQFSSLEVRTTQEPDGREVIGMVFSVRSERQEGAAAEEAASRTTGDEDKIVKATEYVEWAHNGTSALTRISSKKAPKDIVTRRSPLYRRSYVVLETEHGDRLVTEAFEDGTVTWEKNPKDLADRSSLAKVIRCDDCRTANITVANVQSYRAREAYRLRFGASRAKCHNYVQGAYCKASQKPDQSGFLSKSDWIVPMEKEDTKVIKAPCIVGSWDNWAIKRKMPWDENEQAYLFELTLGAKGWESFQLLSDGDAKRRLYPDHEDANPHWKHDILGPDIFGHGFHWTVGKHPNDNGEEGASYKVKLLLNADGTAKEVNWSRLGAPCVAAA
eukprot:gnl/TRDRNA2_/TRDRNA2_177865_c0_seq1.p1 gnl/TRDRNA2_/TRDRNA2_177865_c0~~gnl/TRDRNA2_/TRDRNA2_177865_c0_seq1.p1  ORF type:complete len:957 (+),score=184.45 gnl/TRDRNA2_/TRDRNA2_177865_c0_seq1:1256-4126(+)